jgi:hypothetical protein
MSLAQDLHRRAPLEEDKPSLPAFRIAGLFLASALCVFTIWTVFA